MEEKITKQNKRKNYQIKCKVQVWTLIMWIKLTYFKQIIDMMSII